MGCSHSTEAVPHFIPSEWKCERLEIPNRILKAAHPVQHLSAAISIATDGGLSTQSALSHLDTDLTSPYVPSTTLDRSGTSSWDPVCEGLSRSSTRLNVALLHMQRQLLLNEEYDRRSCSNAVAYAQSNSTRECIFAWRRNIIAPA
jgi:hypothetical protein